MIGIWDRLASGTPSLLQTIALNELQVIAIVLILFAVDKTLINALSEFRYALWLIALARALWPPWVDLPSISVMRDNLATVQLPVLFSTASSVQPDPSSLALGPIILLGWIWVSLTLATFLTTRFVAFQLRLRFSKPVAWDISKAVPRTEHRWPPVYISDRLDSPATVGLLHPRIYLTPASLKSSPGALKAILHHELAHVNRRDGWVSLFQGIVLVLHPLNPLVWFVNKRLSEYREQSCDDFALRRTGMDSREYGHMLLAHLRESIVPVFAFPSRTCFLQTKQSLIKRLLNLKQWKEGNVKVPAPKKRVILIAGITTAMLIMAFQCQTKESPLAQEDAPPPLAKDKAVEFVPYDTPPSPVGGYAAIRQQLIYPEESLKEGSQGTVILQLRILADGTTAQVKLLKDSTGDPRLVDAAMEAVRRTAWNPAKAKGENVSVWISMPVNFNLP